MIGPSELEDEERSFSEISPSPLNQKFVQVVLKQKSRDSVIRLNLFWTVMECISAALHQLAHPTVQPSFNHFEAVSSSYRESPLDERSNPLQYRICKAESNSPHVRLWMKPEALLHTFSVSDGVSYSS